MLPYPQPDDVPFAPLPTSTKVFGAAGVDGSKKVMLRVCTPQGPSVYGLDPAHAKQLAAELAHVAQQCETPGLVVAQPAQAKQALDAMLRGANRMNGGTGGGSW